MKILNITGLILIIAACSTESTTDNNTMSNSNPIITSYSNHQAPKAKQVPHSMTVHNDTRVDEYYWLKNREDQEVIDYLNAENTFTNQVIAPIQSLADTLYEEIVGRIKKDDNSVPYFDNGYFYQTKYVKGGEYPIYSRRKGKIDAPEEILLDVNNNAKDFSYYNATALATSPDNKILAYGEDTLSRRIYTIKFKNLETGEYLEDRLPNTTGSVVWGNDNKTVFYTVKDASLRAYKIFKHVLGSNPGADQEVYHESDETFNAYIYKTKSKKYIFIASVTTLTTEYRYLDADQPGGEFVVMENRNKAEKFEYYVDHFNDKFYIRTNWKAKNFRLMETNINEIKRKYWKEIVAHREDVLLEDLELFNSHIVLSERKNGITQLFVKPWKGEGHYINFGEEAFLAYTSTNRSFDNSSVRIGYQSLTTPGTVYDYDMNDRKLVLKKQEEILGDFDVTNYKSARIFAPSRDGKTQIPISIVHHKDTPIDGTSPALLYGYGSYGSSMEPYFSLSRMSFLDRGFVFAIAHIRGGEEMGHSWYEDGKLLNKKNTFYDFIDCGKHLIKEKYSAPDNLSANGGSAGGLLMGAVINMEPTLWKSVVAAVPFVDVITTMLDETIPLTTGEYDEWGNPNIKDYYDYIKTYSPYDNIEEKAYPHMLVTTGLHDSQVQYWEPAKWVARLRAKKKGDEILLLKTDMEAGHGGASGRFKRFKDVALQYAFFLTLAKS